MKYERAKYVEGIDWTKIPDPVATVKRDGAYFNMVIGPTGEPKFISRRESVKGGYPDRTPNLPHLTSTPVPQLAGNVYAVELVHNKFDKDSKDDHAAVSGILNSLPPRAIETQKQTGPVRAILLNVVTPKLSTYANTLLHLKEVERAFNKPSLIYSQEAKIGKASIQALINETKNKGSEGVIITSLSAPSQGSVLVKIKHKNTYNLKIIGITQEFDIHGKPKQSAGALVVADATGREVANVGTGLTRALRQEIWVNKKAWMGKLIQVEAMDTTAQRLRSPVFNGDADGDWDTI